MARFFIARPIFAWVVAIFICLAGVLAIPFLPIAQYPIIAPPSISIATIYPGASTQNLYFGVTRLIEEELNGAAGILSYESTSDTTGEVEIIASFKSGTDIALASVDVQNRIKRIESRLPEVVRQQGIECGTQGGPGIEHRHDEAGLEPGHGTGAKTAVPRDFRPSLPV